MSPAVIHQSFLFLLLTWTGSTLCGNVLVWPIERSHWLNVKHIIKELLKQGHNVTAMLSTSSILDHLDQPEGMKVELLEVPFGPEKVEALIDDALQLWMYEKPHLSPWRFYERVKIFMANIFNINKPICEVLIRNKERMEKLRQSKFDVILADPVTVGGELLALQLNIPFVYTFRFCPGFSMQRHCAQLPAPPSYVPATLSELNTSMTFTQRIENLLSYVLHDVFFFQFWSEWDSFYSEMLGKVSNSLNECNFATNGD